MIWLYVILILRASTLLKRLLRVSISSFFPAVEVNASQCHGLRPCRRTFGEGGLLGIEGIGVDELGNVLIELHRCGDGRGRRSPRREQWRE